MTYTDLVNSGSIKYSETTYTYEPEKGINMTHIGMIIKVWLTADIKREPDHVFKWRHATRHPQHVRFL